MKDMMLHKVLVVVEKPFRYGEQWMTRGTRIQVPYFEAMVTLRDHVRLENNAPL